MRTPNILIVDYGVGNVASVANMLQKVGAESELSRDAAAIRRARKIILPGVGSFDAGMGALRDRRLDGALAEAVEAGAALLGICLGAQLLLERSDEGELPGLGFVSGCVRRLAFDRDPLPVPQMGWNVVEPGPGATLFETGPEEQRFYFAHSYYLDPECSDDVAATCKYGFDFACALEHKRVYGAQFHPEKSHRFGMTFFEKFVQLEC